MSELRSTSNIVYRCRYHLVFCPKDGRKVLTPPIDARLQVLLAERIERWGQGLIEMEVLPDYAHLLVGCDPQLGIHRLLKRLKGDSSHALRAEFPALKRRLPSLWTNSYVVATARVGRRHRPCSGTSRARRANRAWQSRQYAQDARRIRTGLRPASAQDWGGGATMAPVPHNARPDGSTAKAGARRTLSSRRNRPT
jgi:putative transposase